MFSIKERLIDIRERKNLTQKEIAVALNITQQGYSAYETGTVIPPLEVVVELANIYEISIDELIYGDKYLKEDKILYSLSNEVIKNVLEDKNQREALVDYARYLLYKKEIIKKRK